MISISPAILTKDKKLFTDHLEAFKSKKTVHIDVVSDQHGQEVTIQTNTVLQLLCQFKFKRVELHLIKDDPTQDINELMLYMRSNIITKIVLFLDHAYIKRNLNILKNLYIFNSIAPVVSSSELFEPEFYNMFKEIQIMTVIPGRQGADFIPERMHLVNIMRENGYEGVISIDGGINLNTADFVKSFNINRVVVGSYFSNISNFDTLFDNLNTKLNF